MSSETWYERESRWRACGVPERLIAMMHGSADGTPTGPQETAALAAVGPFLAANDKRTFLVLSGGVGTGKTVAGSWGIAFHGGRLVKAIDIVRVGMFPDDAAYLRRLENISLLVIDDLGTEPLDAKGYGFASLFDLLDKRYDDARKTIVTTNLALGPFKARYGAGAGERLISRIRESGSFVELKGSDLRRASA